MADLHQRRVEQERHLLQGLINANPGVLAIGESQIEPAREALSLSLHKTSALIQTTDGLQSEETHGVTIHFPRFFPSVPMEVSLHRSVFHPNIHPENGFVCLWGRFSPGDTVVEALFQLQRVITWQLVNEEADHLMQPVALQWFRNPVREVPLPLSCTTLHKPDGYDLERTFAKRPPGSRARLS